MLRFYVIIDFIDYQFYRLSMPIDQLIDIDCHRLGLIFMRLHGVWTGPVGKIGNSGNIKFLKIHINPISTV